MVLGCFALKFSYFKPQRSFEIRALETVTRSLNENGLRDRNTACSLAARLEITPVEETRERA